MILFSGVSFPPMTQRLTEIEWLSLFFAGGGNHITSRDSTSITTVGNHSRYLYTIQRVNVYSIHLVNVIRITRWTTQKEHSM